MSLKGMKQGQLYHANVTSLTNTVQILGFNFSASEPRDVATGQPTGKSIFTPVTLYKEMDVASPLLMQVLTTNEIFQATITAVEPATSQYCYSLFGEESFLFELGELILCTSQTAMWQRHSPGNLRTEV